MSLLLCFVPLWPTSISKYASASPLGAEVIISVAPGQAAHHIHVCNAGGRWSDPIDFVLGSNGGRIPSEVSEFDLIGCVLAPGQ